MKKILAIIVLGIIFVSTLGASSLMVSAAGGTGNPFDDAPVGPFPADITL